MIKVKILSKDNYDYDLLDNKGNLYNKNISFYNVDVYPKVGDYMYLTEEMLDEDNIYTFGPLGNDVCNIKDYDIIKVITRTDEFFLRRYYG